MIPAIFSRCLNLIWHYVHSAKSGVHDAHSRLGVWFYFIAKQSFRMISTVYPPPPPPREGDKMTPHYPRFLSLPTWIAVLVMPLLIAPATAQMTSSTDTTLSALTLTQGTLLSTFASDKTTYAFAVQSGATEITVTATPTNSGATVTITPADASAASGHQVDVSSPPVSIRIVVSPATGTTTLTYTVSAGNFTDYDTDGDNLIELGAGQTGLAQLHAMRWDLNADGAIDASASTSDTTAYNAAFPNLPPGMGCDTTCTGYELTANLNFDTDGSGSASSGDTYYNLGTGFVPIGNNATKYTGNFHGNDYTISNLFIDRSVSYTGLFGFAEGGTIRNLSLVNAAVTGNSDTAVLVGQGNRLHLLHIRVTGQVHGRSYSVGGLVGALNHGSSTITACGAEVDITLLVTAGIITAYGGLVGHNKGAITASYATGAVKASYNSGGLVGTHDGSSAVIRASYATGVVHGRNTIGGLVGWANNANLITASYATGAVKGTDNPPDHGGLVGWNSSTPITYSHYDSTTTGRGDTGKGIPQTTAGLQSPTNYTGIYANWNLNLDGQTGNDNPWSFGTTSQYPVLKYAGLDTTAQFNAQRVGKPTVMVAAKTDTLTVTWGLVRNATGYKVRWKSGGQTYPTADLASAMRGQATIGSVFTTTYDISGLTTGTTYTVQVIATRLNAADSSPSDEVMVTPATTKPTNVRVTPAPLQLIVDWTKATGATGYTVQWKSGQQTYNTSSRQATVSGVSTTTYTIENLTFGTTYTVRVTATGGSNSDPSDEVMGTPLDGLTRPTGVTVTPKADTLDVRWTAGSSATGYKVQWKLDGQDYDASREETVTGTRYAIPNLIAGASYLVRVIAIKAGLLDSDPSTEVTGVPLLGSPMGVMVAATVDTLTVTWDAVPNATGYKVQWKSGALTYPTSDLAAATRGQASIGTGITTTYRISGLTIGTSYAVRVIATHTHIADSEPSVEVTGVPVLGSPMGVMVAAKMDTLTVTWDAVDDATGYKVQWKSGALTYPTTDLALTTRGQATIAGGNTTTHKISGVTVGTLYAVRVIATSTNTNIADSTPSDEVMVMPATNRPTNVRVTPGTTQLMVRWTEVTGATGYKVQWKSGQQTYNTSSRQTTVSGVSTTTYTIEALAIGTTYTVRVLATLSGGADSTPSDEVMGTPRGIDYDRDGDGLIDIETLPQLNAIRYDLNGDGGVADTDTMAYNAAFPNRDTTSSGRMGCPSGTCTGYELLNNLNFDTDGSGSVTSADTYPNWTPIGTYSATFKGNNKTISNLYINRGSQYYVGLFSHVSGNISGLGLKNVNVAGRDRVGGLVGNQVGGRILGCYVTGRVAGSSYVGGLVGDASGTSTVIAASYANATVSGWAAVGGLVGERNGGKIIASYASGSVTANGQSAGGLVGVIKFTQNVVIKASYATGTVMGAATDKRGLVGGRNAGGNANLRDAFTAPDSYWDTESSGLASSYGGTGKTTSALQSQTSYTDIYTQWNVDVDGRPGNDDPWTFGAANQYPVLKYDGMDTAAQFAMQPLGGMPTNVTVTLRGTGLEVRWTAVTNATGYKVQWKSGSEMYPTADLASSALRGQATITDGRTTSYAIANLTFGTTYTVRVIATNNTGDSDPSSEVTGTITNISYDSDGDGLIDIKTLAQLHAIRWDLNGDGVVADTDTMNYNAAFPNRDTTSNIRMGCPSGTCTGYELLNNLDFDENNDGAITSADATYWNSGQGWMPIGSDANPASRYTGDFKGNGYTVQNLFISRSAVSYQALFGGTGTNSRIESLGVTDADVTADDFSAILAGANRGEIVACYTTGRITGDNVVGGLVGWTGGSISTSYSRASVSATQNLGGLVGSKAAAGSITNSYSTGAVSLSSGSMTSIGGLLGESNAGTGTVTDSYWDTTTSGRTTSFGGSGAAGKTTSELQSPTTYGATTNDTYYNWNANLDGQAGNDDPWTFGATNQYPVLKYAGMDTTVQFQLQPAVVTLALTPSSISESGGMSTVTATLAHPLSAATTITVRPVAGAYTVGSDSTITIAAGSTANATDTVVITAVDNTQDEPHRDVTVSGVAGNAQGAGRVTEATLTLEDNDPAPTATLAASPASISENGAVSTVTASLSRPSSATTTITVRPVTGAYTVGSDTTITIAAGDTINASDTVVITAVDNTQDAPNRDVTVLGVMSNTQGAGSVTGASLTLTDDDVAPDVTMVLSPASISENGAISTVTATLSHTSSDPTTITVSASAVSPAVPGDYTLSTPATLTVAAGQTMSTGTVTITTVDNNISSGNKTVTVSSTVGNSIGTGSVTDATLTIIDDEVAQVTLVLTPASITENAQISTITATLDRVATVATTVTVSATAVAPAVAGDFTLSTTTTLTFAANTTSTGTVTITSVNDTTDAPDKEVTVSATVAGGNGASLSSAVTLTITDDEAAPDVALTLSPASIAETGGVSTITATLSHRSSAATTITVRPVAGAYTVGSDSTITIAAGSTANATDTVEITAVDNATDAPNNDVTVSVEVSNDQGAGSVTEATLTLEDDDAAPDVTLMLMPASISEAGGVSTVTATLTHPSSAATTIKVRPVANAYTVGSDSTITIAAGSTANASDTVALTAVDNDIDASDNAVMVQTAAVENDHGAGSVTTASLTITDDDEAAIDVSPATSTTIRLQTTESGRAETFTVTLATEPTGNVALSVVSSETTEGTVSPSVLTFMPSNWNTAQTVTVTGQDDAPTNSPDGNQNYTVTLSVNQTDTQDDNYDALTAISVYMVNRDNDFGLDIGAVTGQATEAGASATFTVALLTQPSAAVTISVTSQDPSEGRVEPAVLTFTTSGYNTAQTVTVTGQDDTIHDGDVTWTVRLASSSGDTGYNNLSDDVPVTTTDDDEAPTVTLVLMPSSISENAEVSTVSATLSHPSSAITTITVSATPVSPATASDFTLSSADTLIIAATATTSTGTVTITAVDNDDRADDKTVSVSATANNAQGITAPAPVTLTLTDDEIPSTNLDVDDDGGVYLLSDMLLIIRHLLGFEEGTLTPGLVTPDARRRTYRELDAYIGTLTQRLDVDEDGGVYLLSDMLLIIRHLLGFEEGTLTPGLVTPDARRRTYRELDAYIDNLYPPSP